MKFNGAAALAAVVGLCSVHAFNIGTPLGMPSRQASTGRARSVSMLDKPNTPAAAAAPIKKKRSITVQFVQETPAGYISVVDVKNFKATTNHRIVMSKEQLAQYSELAGKQVEVGDFMGYVMKYMLDKGIKLDNTEGMIEASVFPVNYFTLKQLSYFHDDVEEKIVALCKEAPDLSEL
ncbi:unnamed protein product [Ectocarpus sp. 8 AP-2014]